MYKYEPDIHNFIGTYKYRANIKLFIQEILSIKPHEFTKHRTAVLLCISQYLQQFHRNVYKSEPDIMHSFCRLILLQLCEIPDCVSKAVNNMDTDGATQYGV